MERTLSEQQQDIISDTVVNQKVGRPYDLQLTPIATQNTINLDNLKSIHSTKHQPSAIYTVLGWLWLRGLGGGSIHFTKQSGLPQKKQKKKILNTSHMY